MQIFRNADHVSDISTVIALGCFDGVHTGHAAVLNTAKRKSLELGVPMCVFCFSEPPKNYFAPRSVPLLTTREDKLELLSTIGADMTVCIDLNVGLLSLDAESFVNDILIKNLKASHIVCGFDYSFGKGAKGNAELIRKICNEKGVGVTVVSEHMKGDVSVSSSQIRLEIANGNMENATKLLGRSYSVSGEVINGQHLARRLGFPTVNIIPRPDVALPKKGVYVTRISFDGQSKYGITNVGMRPTVDTNILCAETHIFDFDGDLYGKTIRIEFLHFLREETKFDSVEQMAEQIKKDIETARNYIEK